MSYEQQHTFTNETLTPAKLNEEFAAIEAGTGAGNYVELTGAQTVAGIKTFTSIPVLPNSNPTSDNQATRKKYADDLQPSGGTGLTLAGALGSYVINHDAHTGEVTGSGALTITAKAVNHSHMEDGSVNSPGCRSVTANVAGHSSSWSGQDDYDVYVPASAVTLSARLLATESGDGAQLRLYNVTTGGGSGVAIIGDVITLTLTVSSISGWQKIIIQGYASPNRDITTKLAGWAWTT